MATTKKTEKPRKKAVSGELSFLDVRQAARDGQKSFRHLCDQRQASNLQVGLNARCQNLSSISKNQSLGKFGPDAHSRTEWGSFLRTVHSDMVAPWILGRVIYPDIDD